MAEPPDTVLEVSEQEAEAIRRAVSGANRVVTPYGTYLPAQTRDADALFALLSDARVSAPLYTIAKPVTRQWVFDWIRAHEQERARGDGILLLARNDEGEVAGFADAQIWPDLSAAELGGGIRADLQSASLGGRGAAALFDWLFRGVGVRLLAMTNALENVRTAKLLAALGFKRGADRICRTADGGVRPSMYWELLRDDWRPPAYREGEPGSR
jgi:RimJ/RimL family protein N-acetyltransferase